MSEQAIPREPIISPRFVELVQEMFAEAVAAAERKMLEDQRPITVQELAERTGQTATAIYAQLKRRRENGLEASGALHKPPGARRGWRIQPDLYAVWLSGESPT